MSNQIKYCLLLLAVMLFFQSCNSVSADNQESNINSNFKKIKIIGEEHKNGIFDISVEYNDDGVGWMVYSRVTLPKNVETRLAKSTDHGRTWEYIRSINKSFDDSVTRDSKTISGTWRYETPTLLFDPADSPERRWKLFTQRYFSVPPHKKGNSLFAQGWIEYRYAAQPDKNWSKPECLFGKWDKACHLNLNSLHPDLSKFAFYNEMGSISVDGIIYLSLDASPTASGLGKWRKRKIILVSSDNHGESWNYSGTLTNINDANNLGYHVLTGSSLVKESNKLFLLVTPSGAKGFGKKNRAHDGTLAVKIEDITTARLNRDSEGMLIVHKKFKPNLHSGGLSDYHEMNTNGGILFSQIDPKSPPEVFQTFDTLEGIYIR